MHTLPTTPAAVCMQIIRHRQPVSRALLVKLSGKSQPTITRAITALIDAGLVQERPDLATSNGPGRPTVPVELASSPWVHVGVAIGTHSTYLGAFNSRGKALREHFVEVTPAQITPAEFLTTLTPHITALVEATGLPLANLGVSTSGTVDDRGLVTADNLGWEDVHLQELFAGRFSVPLTITGVIDAIALAEQQLHSPENLSSVLMIYADDSRGAAILNQQGIQRLDINSAGNAPLGYLAVALANKTNPQAIVLSGGDFANPQDARAVGLAIKSSRHRDVEIRVIPTHLDNARAAARAVALDRLISDPLALAKEIATRS